MRMIARPGRSPARRQETGTLPYAKGRHYQRLWSMRMIARPGRSPVRRRGQCYHDQWDRQGSPLRRVSLWQGTQPRLDRGTPPPPTRLRGWGVRRPGPLSHGPDSSKTPLPTLCDRSAGGVTRGRLLPRGLSVARGPGESPFNGTKATTGSRQVYHNGGSRELGGGGLKARRVAV
jgi:hypothetical protein